MSDTFPELVGNWWLGDRLGSGYSGSIFKATHIHTRQVAALKLQLVDHECPTNRYERVFYPLLQGGRGMPILFGSGVQGEYDYLVIELLGQSLDTLFRKSGQKTMDLRSVCCIAMQLIKRLELMHNRGVLHRDIQLGNCVIGLPPHEKTLYMIDFGFSKVYLDQTTGQHIADSKKKRDFIGNYWFSSVAVHCKGRVPSRRDDMEALALMLVHLLTPGGLSWTRNGVPKTDEAHARLKREKQNARPEDLCYGLPSEFEEFLRYCRSLQFAERPDYSRWHEAFQDLAADEGFPTSSAFNWPAQQPTRYVQVTKVKRVKRDDTQAKSVNVDQLMKDLANLRLGERSVLGSKDNNVVRLSNAAPAAKPDKPKKTRVASQDEVVALGGDSGYGSQREAVVRLTKASELARLTRLVQDTTDNVALSYIVHEFVDLLDSSRSRTLTKEGFTFLDVLYKQLAGQSVTTIPLRTSRRQIDEDVDDGNARRARMTKLLGLRRDVVHAKSNKKLAQLVSEFGACIDKTKNRTITKDAFAFLEGLSSTLKKLS